MTAAMAAMSSMIGSDSYRAISKVPAMKFSRGKSGTAFTKGKRVKSLKVRANRRKAKAKKRG